MYYEGRIDEIDIKKAICLSEDCFFIVYLRDHRRKYNIYNLRVTCSAVTKGRKKHLTEIDKRASSAAQAQDYHRRRANS